MLKINNRRYIGSKTKLVDIIDNLIMDRNVGLKYKSFADIFAGTGVVAYHFANKGYTTYINDSLYSNFVAYQAWFSNENVDLLKINSFINEFNNTNGETLEDNYFSNVYGNKYFSVNDSKKIGFFREKLEDMKDQFTSREYYYLLSSLLYFTDKIANTVGHFEHYLNKVLTDTKEQLLNLDIKNLDNTHIYNLDANILVKQIKADIVYLDPPYNARQYINFYHVLENLARWDKPTEFEGKSMKFKRNHLKSGYSQAKAKILMEDLIKNIDAHLILVSYNNTYNAKSGASNNKILESEMLDILNKKGKTSIVEIPYKSFNSGKTNFKNHKEKIFICEVSK